MTKVTMEISGMTCGHCVSAVSRTLASIAGVEVEQVAVGTAVVNYDPATVSPARIEQAIEDGGYAVTGTR